MWVIRSFSWVGRVNRLNQNFLEALPAYMQQADSQHESIKGEEGGGGNKGKEKEKEKKKKRKEMLGAPGWLSL